MTTDKKKLQVKCPKCKKKFEYYSSKFRPFCTERCKMIDLGHWLDESYSVPANENLEEADIERILREGGNNEDDL
jgi:endogenous inhibitor of DNA gyrase (YacG/DUF329 family)